MKTLIKVEQSALKEVIDHKKGEEYLSGVCSAYLACYRFISAAHHFQISVSKEKSELDNLWKTIGTLLRDVLTNQNQDQLLFNLDGGLIGLL